MDELTKRSQALLQRARAAREPTEDDKARVQARLSAALAAGVAGGAASGGGGAAGGAASGGGGAAGGAAGAGSASATGGLAGAGVAKGAAGAAGAGAAAGVVGAGAVGAGATSAAMGTGSWLAGVVAALTIGGLAAGGAVLFTSDGAEVGASKGPSVWRAPTGTPAGASTDEPSIGPAPAGSAMDARGPDAREARPAPSQSSAAAGAAAGRSDNRDGDALGRDRGGERSRDPARGGDRASPDSQSNLRSRAGARAGSRSARPRRAPRRKGVQSPDLAAEVALLRDADEALQAGEAARALALLRVHAHRFGDSQLWAERDATRILALCALGRVDEARRRARHWMAHAGASPLRASIRSSCAYR